MNWKDIDWSNVPDAGGMTGKPNKVYGIPENCGVVGCWGTDSQGRKTLNGKLYIEPKKILCNDGTYDFEAQEPSTGMVGKVAMPCRNKGGIAKNQPTSPTIQGNTTKEPIFYILVTAVVLLAGYFAYKKFKK